MSTSLTLATAQAIAFLTRPLIRAYPAPTVIQLQMLLDASLQAHYAPTWSPAEPLQGSGRRCLTLSPACLPPKVIYSACLASGVQWFDWIALLGQREFDFFVDPGCVSVRYPSDGKLHTIWSDELPSPVVSTLPPSRRAVGAERFNPRITIGDSDDDDDLFTIIHNHVQPTTPKGPSSHGPWLSVLRSSSPLSSASSSASSPSSTRSLSAVPFLTHSRSSSRASNISISSSSSTSSSSSSTSTGGNSSSSHLSRRERARQAKVFVDKSKKEVTPYDGGKTTVLTGGVMLGGTAKAHKRTCSDVNATSWRF